MPRPADDGDRERVRRAARLGPAAHAAGVRHAHRRLHRVRRGAERAERRQEGVREQHDPVEEELHGTGQPEQLGLVHAQFIVGDAPTAEQQVVRVSGWRVMHEVGFFSPTSDIV